MGMQLRVAPFAAIALASAAGSAHSQDCLWQFNPSTGPSLSSGQSSYDSVRQRVVLGYESTEFRTYEYDGASWTLRDNNTPGRRHHSRTAYDSARQRTVLFGGYTPAPLTYIPNTWEWDGTQWTIVATTGPNPRAWYGMAYDAARGKTVIHGGRGAGSTFFDDTWEWDGVAWLQRSGSGPGPRSEHVMAYDSVRGRTVVFGGMNASGALLDDTWEWDGSAWAQSPATGPSQRRSASMAFDSARGRMVLFGGNLNQGYAGDLWEFDGAVWTLRVPAGPTAGFDMPAAFDSHRLRVVTYHNAQGTLEYNGSAANTSLWFSSNPASVLVFAPTPVVLSATVEGTGPISYQWSKDNVPLVNGGNISGVTTNTLTISPTSTSDAGHYTLAATNPCGTVQTGALVQIGLPTCYPNCDASTILPLLNVNDFLCFANRFAAGDTYANCDNSSIPPILNVNDFTCFLGRFGVGCPL